LQLIKRTVDYGCGLHLPGLAGLLQMKQSAAFLALSRWAFPGRGKKRPISSSATALDGFIRCGVMARQSHPALEMPSKYNVS
jgi:hypothetical protein